MEIKFVPPQFYLGVLDNSHVGDARRKAISFARACGMEETQLSTVGIIVTELANNLVRHAVQGYLALQWVTNSFGDSMEVVSIDRGPGMNDVGKCLQDGYTTSGTPGNGLGAVQRLSNEFDIYSVPTRGTVIVSRVSRNGQPLDTPGRFVRWGAYSKAVSGEQLCGDIWRVACNRKNFRCMVADGLGHGPAAAEAAEAVAGTFDRDSTLNPGEFIKLAHESVAGTRGAAAAMGHLDMATNTFSYAGIGNISGLLLDEKTGSKGLFSHNGTLGVQLYKVQTFDYTWPANGLLIMHSDGLQSRWALSSYPGLPTRHPALIAAVLARDFTRERDDITVLVAKLEGQDSG